MDNHRGLLLNWTYSLHQEKSMDELRQSLLLTMELEDTKFKAQEELKMRDEQITQLKALLNNAISERDEAQQNLQKALLENTILRKQLQKCQQQSTTTPHSAVSSIEDDNPKRVMLIENSNNGGVSSSDCDESIGSSPPREFDFPAAVMNKPFPEKGKLLEAVMKAGPLLQTLLLAGPLPRWRHPPPPLDVDRIPPPPVMVPPSQSLQGSIIVTRKRVHQ